MNNASTMTLVVIVVLAATNFTHGEHQILQEDIMRAVSVFTVGFFLSVMAQGTCVAESNNAVESLQGKYEGKLESHGKRTFEYDSQIEIEPVDRKGNTVSLTVYCRDCETAQEWRRTQCGITEQGENIKFVCKSKTGDESYLYKDGLLEISGFGKKYPYTIHARKVTK